MRNSLLKAILTSLLFTTGVHAADVPYEHNGSQMRLSQNGEQVRITYSKPRSGLSALGVRTGTLLFEGTLRNGMLEGMSRIFNANCGEVDYYVYGEFAAGRSFTLNGAAPVLSNMSCRIVDNTYDGPNAKLVFTAAGSEARQATGCVTGVNTTLNMRVGPGERYGRIGEIPKQTCGITVLNRCQDGWCAVTGQGKTGWVSMRYIRQ